MTMQIQFKSTSIRRAFTEELQSMHLMHFPMYLPCTVVTDERAFTNWALTSCPKHLKGLVKVGRARDTSIHKRKLLMHTLVYEYLLFLQEQGVCRMPRKLARMIENHKQIVLDLQAKPHTRASL